MENPILNTELSKFISKMNINRLEIPTTKQEEWRFTNLSFLKNKTFNSNNKSILKPLNNNLKSDNKNQIYIVNNCIQNDLQEFNVIEGLDILNMNSALKKYPQIFNDYFSKIYTYKDDYFSSENMLQINNGIFIFVQKNHHIDLPLECIFSSIDSNKQILPRIFIYCSSNSNFSFIEKYISEDDTDSYTNVITEIYLEENSSKLSFTALRCCICDRVLDSWGVREPLSLPSFC